MHLMLMLVGNNRNFFVFGRIEVSNVMFRDNTRIYLSVKN